MATSSFMREFNVPSKKADEFVEEMTKEGVPTLSKEFKSKYVSLSQDDELRNRVYRSLTRM